MNRKLGKREPKLDKRTLRLSRYLAALSPSLPSVDYKSNVRDWLMYHNDKVGNCTIAALAHAVQTWTQVTGPGYSPDEQIALDYYAKWGGWNPADPEATDNGAYMLDVLVRWRQQSFGAIPLKAFASVDRENTEHIKKAIELFGGVYIGLALPISAFSQRVWDVLPNPDDLDAIPNSWGPHALWVNHYDRDVLSSVTWGYVQEMTWAYFLRYCDEAYALLSPVWLQWAPRDFPLGDLEGDLKLVTA